MRFEPQHVICSSTALQREILCLPRRRREECYQQVGLFDGQLQMGPTQVQL